ncbi:MAG: DinB family protein, partial [Bacteroidetes bacterium]|nr:DinB family protein [Bacteroidota bacterium]
MIKQLLQQYAEYNIWANNKMREAVNLLSHEQQHKEIISSFDSIYKTVFHLYGSSFLWWKRMHKEPGVLRPADGFNSSMKDLNAAWNEMDKQWAVFIKGFPEEALYEKLDYSTLKGEPCSVEIYLVLQHVFNHCAYHRGQLVTMLRQVGAA